MDPYLLNSIDRSRIYDAIDTYDMGNVIQEAIKAITRKNSVRSALSSDINIEKTEIKSEVASREVRMLGNASYKAGEMRQATEFYNKALALAPKFSEEMILAYSNRSAVFFQKRYISACLKDIQICLSLSCSVRLAEKLMKRREDANKLLFHEFAVKMMNQHSFVHSYLKINDPHTQVPCVRSDVSFETVTVKAANEIKAGSVVGIEKAFVAESNNTFMSCYYCKRLEPCLYPCDGCSVLFCDEECRKRCLKEFHCIECLVADQLHSTHHKVQLAVRAAIKMSLKVTWDCFVAASEIAGDSKMTTDTIKEAYSPDAPLSILSYMEDEPFMEDNDKRDAAVVALGRVMLQLYTTFTNGIDIYSSAFNLDNNIFEGASQHCYGLFSMSSKLKHSCEPNLLVLGLNNTVALIALKNIKQGEELTISYGGIFYDHIIQYEDTIHRINSRFLRTGRICKDCRVCMENWNRNVVKADMTKKQEKIYKKFTTSPNISLEHLQTIFDVLNSLPFNSEQYFTAYEHLRGLLNIAQCQFYNNYTFS